MVEVRRLEHVSDYIEISDKDDPGDSICITTNDIASLIRQLEDVLAEVEAEEAEAEIEFDKLDWED